MRLLILIAGAGLLLAACSSDHLVDYSLPDLGTGARHVVISGDTAGDGIVLSNADGSAYVLLGNDSNAASTVVYRRSTGTARWKRIPALTASPTFTLKLDEADTAVAPTLPQSASVFSTSNNGAVTSFTLKPDGTISAANSGCLISGAIKSATGQPSASVSLNFAQCGSVAGAYSGVAFVDSDAPNARMRVVVDNGADIQDFYVYTN